MKHPKYITFRYIDIVAFGLVATHHHFQEKEVSLSSLCSYRDAVCAKLLEENIHADCKMDLRRLQEMKEKPQKYILVTENEENIVFSLKCSSTKLEKEICQKMTPEVVFAFRDERVIAALKEPFVVEPKVKRRMSI